MSERRAPVRSTPVTDASERDSQSPSQRELIRSHMKMVIDQLEGILKELKDVAHELREVVGQIDKLTSDFDFDLEADDWTVATASSTSSSERGLGEAFRLDFLSHDLLSDSWEFCNYLEASASASASASTSTSTAPGASAGPGLASGSASRLGGGGSRGGGAVTRTKSVGVRASTTAVQTGDETSDSGSGSGPPGRTGGLVSPPSATSPPPPPTTATVGTTTTGTCTSTASAYSQMNGGVPLIPNGPLIVTPDSSSEEASSSTHSQKTSRTSGTRERVRFSDKILYHALCCDDDEDEEEEEEEEAYGVGEDGDEDEEDEEEEEGEVDEEDDDKRDCGTPDTDSELSPLACSPIPPLSSLISSAATEHSRLQNCLSDPATPSSTSSIPSLVGRLPLGTPSLGRKGLLQPSCRKKLLRNSSTQTVSDKSTQTVLPYVPAKQKTKDH